MPCDYSKYPPNWKSEIRPAILARAGGKCEWCGVPDRVWIIRPADNPADWWEFESRDEAEEYHAEMWAIDEANAKKTRVALVVLTIAHTGPNKHDKMDTSSLFALCQRCHLREDRAEHAANAKATRDRKNGQGALI